MRERKKIEKDWSDLAVYNRVGALKTELELVLETLLDIRDLLTPKNPNNPKKNNPEYIKRI